MIGRTLLAVRPIGAQVQNRGMAAVKNWKRPSMDEYLAPSQPFAQVNNPRQNRYNMTLAFGVVFLASTMSFGYVMDLIEMRGTPHHVMKK
jgi:hypothetical protein